MTRNDVANWLWRTASFVCVFAAAAIWLGQVAIDRRIQSGETVGKIVYSPDDSKVAVVNVRTQAINVWDVKSKTSLGRCELTRAVPSFLAFSPDSKRLASSAHGFLEAQHGRLFPARVDIFCPDMSMKPERTIYLKDAVIAAIGFVDDATVAVLLRHSIGMYDISTGRQTSNLALPPNTLDELCVTKDGHLIVFGATSQTQRVAVYDASDGRTLLDVPQALSKVNSVDVSRDGRWVAVAGRGAGSGGRLRVWNLDSGTELSCDAGVPELTRVCILEDSSIVITIDQASVLTVWRRSGEIVRRFKQQRLDGSPGSFAVARNDREAAIVTSRSVSTWDLDSGKIELSLVESSHLYTLRRVTRYGKWVFVVLGISMFLWSMRSYMRLPR